MSDHHHDNNHDHGHGDGHEHGHDHDEETSGPNLYSKIDISNVSVLNSPHPASNAIKPWNSRLNDLFIESDEDVDDQLILRIPFTGSVKLRSLLLRSGPDSQTPKTIRLFATDDQLDFSDVEIARPTQELAIVQTSEVAQYALKTAAFSNVRCLTVFFPEAQGRETTRISYIGFTGDFVELKNQPVVTVYETQANLADHEKIQGTDGFLSRPGM
ncbi:hypothetical protein BS47DRAFT_1326836 [Hydnum rufescens UP504]|uniref:PITH domain-containing protein n=1 Tax=Hydnum rufescens UP504 TaxID=1448309 RepID=A0A9P6B3I4_9AGAM|nr:hypothetical protein BS47DRAFT_1326836 [Hydnum rufescens UP504]